MVRTACTEPQCLYKGALYLYLYLFDHKIQRNTVCIFISSQIIIRFEKIISIKSDYLTYYIYIYIYIRR